MMQDLLRILLHSHCIRMRQNNNTRSEMKKKQQNSKEIKLTTIDDIYHHSYKS